jgi:hypothetical protein
LVPYERIKYPKVKLPPVQLDDRYARPPLEQLNVVPQIY